MKRFFKFIFTIDESFMTYMNSLSPSSLDFEIRSMEQISDYKLFIKTMKSSLLTGKNFELVQAYLNVFLKVNYNKKELFLIILLDSWRKYT